MGFLLLALSCCWFYSLGNAYGNASDTFGTWYLDGSDRGTKDVSGHAGATYQSSAPFGAALHLDQNAYATINRAEIWNTDFTMHMYIKSTAGGGQRRTILGSWETAKWLFLFRITLANQLQVALRRNKYNTGSDPRQDMVSVTGGNIELGQWYSVAFSWERQTGEAKIYINGLEVGAKQTTYTDRDLMRNSAPTFQIGYKADGRHQFFQGYIAELSISNGVLDTGDLARLAAVIAPTVTTNSSPPPQPVTPGPTDEEVPEALRLCTMTRVDNARMLSTSIEPLPEIQTEGACAAKCLEVPLCDSATFRNDSKECIIHPRRDFMMGQMAPEGCCVLFRKECALLKNLDVPPPEQVICPVDVSVRQPSQKYAYRQLRFVKSYDIGAYSCRIDTLCAGFSSEKAAASTDWHFTYYYNATPEEGAQVSSEVTNAVKNCKPSGQACRLVTALFNKRPRDEEPNSIVTGVATQADCLAACEKDSQCTVATFTDSMEKECRLHTDFYTEGGLGTMEFEVYTGIGTAMTWVKVMQCNVAYT